MAKPLFFLLSLGFVVFIYGSEAQAQGTHGSTGHGPGARIGTVSPGPHNLPAGNAFGLGTPFGYEVSQGHTEELKTATPSPTPLGGAPNGSGGPLAASTGTSFSGPGQNGWIPYDAAIAVGPNHIIVMSNAQFAVFGKDKTLYSLTQYDNFFGTAAGTAFDPKCFYDATAGHFVMLTDMSSNPQAYMNVAVSKTSDPTGGWWIYQLDWTLDGSAKTGNWGDYPSLGYDNNAIYIGANQYSFSNSYKYSKVRVLSKAELYSGASTVTWTDFVNLLNSNGSSAFTVKAGRMLSSSNSEYLLNTLPGGGSYVSLWRIDNAPASPTLTRVATVSVGSYAVPPNGRQPGGSSVASGDCRTQDVVMQNGVVYTAFSEKYGTTRRNQGAGIRFLEITTSGLKNVDISYFYSGIDQFYPAVTVDATGNVYMVFSRSSKTEYASMYQTGMKTTETSIEAPGLVRAGSSTITYGRWGDYSGIANDPSNSGAVWEYCGWAAPGGTWGTWVTSASFSGTAPKIAVNGIDNSTPAAFSLHQNYPNPFNPSTLIAYDLPRDAQVKLTVYDVLGREVSVLVNEIEAAGAHSVRFDAAGLSSGAYFYRLEAGNFVQIRKLSLLR
jgi:hypothetical protein